MEVQIVKRDGRTVSHSFPVPTGVDETTFDPTNDKSTTRRSGDYVSEIIEEFIPYDGGWAYRRSAQCNYGTEISLDDDYAATDRRCFPRAPKYEVATRVVVPRGDMASVRLIIVNGVTVYDCDEEVIDDGC